MVIADTELQSRAALDESAVEEYAELLAVGTSFPPVIVFDVDGTYLLVDGFHRYAAHKKSGKITIRAEVRQGDRRSAILHSIGANVSHGVRRTNEDKRRAVALLLSDAEWNSWSSAKIAKVCGVSDRFVESRRKTTPNASESRVRKTTRNGKEVPVDTANIGTKKSKNTTPEEEATGDEASLADARCELIKAMNALLTVLETEGNPERCRTSDLIEVVNERLAMFKASVEAA